MRNAANVFVHTGKLGPGCLGPGDSLVHTQLVRVVTEVIALTDNDGNNSNCD